MLSASSHTSESLRYSSKLQPLDVGHTLLISGKTKEKAECFEFYLGSENDDEGDIILHTKVNFLGSGDIVRSSRGKRVSWKDVEERRENLITKNPMNPITRGSDFGMSVLFDSGFFLISVNGKPFCTFPYHKPLHEFRQLKINGDIEKIYKVEHSKEFVLNDSRAFKSAFPSLDHGAVLVLNATPRESQRSDFRIKLFEKNSGRELINIFADLKSQEMR